MSAGKRFEARPPMASMTSLGRRDFESRERGAASSRKTRKPNQGPWPHCGPGRPSLPLRPLGAGKGCLLPRLSASPSRFLRGLRWHRGSILQSPSAGLSRSFLRVPFRRGSAPDPSRGRGLACAQPAKPAFQASALWAVQELRSSAGRASALQASPVTSPALPFPLAQSPRTAPPNFFCSPRLYNLRHVLCSGRPTPPPGGSPPALRSRPFRPSGPRLPNCPA